MVDTWEFCATTEAANRPRAVVISNQPFEELFARVKRVCAGLQNGLGKGVKREPLATAVARLLS